MKSKFTFSLLSILSLAALVGCQPKVSLPSAEKPTEEKPTEKVTEQGKESASNKDPNAYVDEKYPTPDKKVELTRSAYYDNNDRHRKFLEGSAAKLPYTGADGTTYKAGTSNRSGVKGRKTSTGPSMMFLRTARFLSRITSTILNPKASNPVKRLSTSLRVTPIKS